MSTRHSRWYRNAFLLASGGNEPDLTRVALKGLEECVELLFACGLPPNQLVACFNTALQKEITRRAVQQAPWTGTILSDAVEPNWPNVVAEMADVHIVHNTFIGLCDAHFSLDDVKWAIEVKTETNLHRKWRVNKFGSLSHVKE